LSVDPGVNHPTALLDVAVSQRGYLLPDGRLTAHDDLFVVRAWKESNRTIGQIGEKIHEWNDTAKYYKVIIDPASSQRSQQDMRCFRDVLYQDYGITCDLPPQQEGVRLSFNAIMGHMKPMLVPREDGTPRFRAFKEGAKVFIEELRRIRWPDDTSRTSGSPKWVPVEDDLTQAWKFLATSEPLWIDPEESLYRNLEIIRRPVVEEDDAELLEHIEMLRTLRLHRQRMKSNSRFIGVA